MFVPLDPTGEHYVGREIEVFARQIVAPGGEDRPLLVFLQGGPGGAGPRVGDFREGWIGEALRNYRVLLLDQRGTGQSTALSQPIILAEENPELFLTMFLQNQILADAEAFRAELADGRKWSTMGQSYGGFLTLGYLSQYPDAVTESYVTGGMAGLCGIDDIYRLTYAQVAKRNREYFARYPHDQQIIREVAAHLLDTEEVLPTGERLTPTRMRSVGMRLGGAMAFDGLHYLWEGPFEDRGGKRRLTPRFLHEIGNELSNGMSPLYWTIHEAIYGQTTFEATGGPTNWAAERLSSQFDGFSLEADPLDMSSPWYLSAEHCYRALIAEDPSTAELMPAAEKLNQRTEWQKTYDREVLESCDVPLAALIYHGDIYVPRSLSEETAAILPRARTWVTNEMQHDGLRANGKEVFSRLYELVRD